MRGSIRISVTGPRGSGKTVTAARLVAVLRTFGYEALYVGPPSDRKETVEAMLRSGHPLAGSEPVRFVVEDLE
jgi:nucleoside-triphosphatase THEP1